VSNVSAKSVLRMHINCYFLSFGQNIDTALGFGDRDFLSGSDILAIGQHSPAFLGSTENAELENAGPENARPILLRKMNCKKNAKSAVHRCIISCLSVLIMTAVLRRGI